MFEVAITEKKGIDRRFIRKGPVVVDERQHRYARQALGEGVYSGLTWIYTRYKSEVPNISGLGSGLVNAYRINNIFQLNKFLQKVNRSLDKGQYFMICMETKESRKERILNKAPKIFTYPYYCFDFVWKRILPKLDSTRNLYFKFTHGRNRVLSLTEGLARLQCCGFEILKYSNVDGLTCIVSKKLKEPNYSSYSTKGAIIKLKRVGKNGKIINVYKMRTMHPYSEYLQDYVFATNNLEDGGKFKDDFRLTTWGRIFRKYWIDEVPMFVNWFKGEMKLVGVRPLTQQYFELYPEDLQELRIKVKPGLVPPYYADMPKDFDEILESERKYLLAYKQNPILTDIKYFFKVFINIFFQGARSN